MVLPHPPDCVYLYACTFAVSNYSCTTIPTILFKQLTDTYCFQNWVMSLIVLINDNENHQNYSVFHSYWCAMTFINHFWAMTKAPPRSRGKFKHFEKYWICSCGCGRVWKRPTWPVTIRAWQLYINALFRLLCSTLLRTSGFSPRCGLEKCRIHLWNE